MRYQIRKRYDHNEGLSCVFRQWRAPETHCSKLHGYALAIEFLFESDTLDHRNWVISFGELKEVKQYLKDILDHQTLVAKDDPEIDWYQEAARRGILQLQVVDNVGCEMFAKMIYEAAMSTLAQKMYKNDVGLTSVTVSEHSGNSATYSPHTAEDRTSRLPAIPLKADDQVKTWLPPRIDRPTSYYQIGGQAFGGQGTLYNGPDITVGPAKSLDIAATSLTPERAKI